VGWQRTQTQEFAPSSSDSPLWNTCIKNIEKPVYTFITNLAQKRFVIPELSIDVFSVKTMHERTQFDRLNWTIDQCQLLLIECPGYIKESATKIWKLIHIQAVMFMKKIYKTREPKRPWVAHLRKRSRVTVELFTEDH